MSINLRTLVLVFILLNTSLLSASQTYILSYRAQIKNAVVISESYHFTEAMSPIKAKTAQKLTIYSPKETDLKHIMKKNKDKIIEFLMKYGVHTRSHEKLIDMKSSSLIELTLPPTYLTIEFNDNYAIITRLIQE